MRQITFPRNCQWILLFILGISVVLIVLIPLGAVHKLGVSPANSQQDRAGYQQAPSVTIVITIPSATPRIVPSTLSPSADPSFSPSALPSTLPSILFVPTTTIPSILSSDVTDTLSSNLPSPFLPSNFPSPAPNPLASNLPSPLPRAIPVALNTIPLTLSPTTAQTGPVVSKYPSLSPTPSVIPIPANVSPWNTPMPSMDPDGFTFQQLIAEGVTYRPGFLNVSENGLLLSVGLTSRIIATSNMTVLYHNGLVSDILFHDNPDFGATFAVPDDAVENRGGWVYASNSEIKETGKGGVGAITFDKDGNVIDYQMVLTNTTMNCGGGRTPWNTWVSCEEVSEDGQIYQVDPFGNRAAEMTSVGGDGGRFESFTFDVRDPNQPHFYASEDRRHGAVRRFTPIGVNWEDPWEMLHGNGTLSFLVLEPSETNEDLGTFRWTEDQEEAKDNAYDNYPECEGIDADGHLLYLISKRLKVLFILNLDEFSYGRYSTENGLFDGAPDQVKRILNDDHDMLYFTEEAGTTSGVHGRNSVGQFFTILEGADYHDETTGLSFSPDGRHLYVAFQKTGYLFDVTRTDGLPFQGKTLNVNYHNAAVNVFDTFT